MRLSVVKGRLVIVQIFVRAFERAGAAGPCVSLPLVAVLTPLLMIIYCKLRRQKRRSVGLLPDATGLAAVESGSASDRPRHMLCVPHSGT